MPNKILYCATEDDHFHAFHLPYFEWFKGLGWEVHVAARGNMNLPFVDKKFDIPIERSPVSLKNIKAYSELKRIIEDNNYQLLHCHTPVGGVITRLAARQARKKGTKVIYTAHGFHFYKGASLANWLLFYPVEKYLSKITDCLVTINNEDYELAVKKGFHARRIEHIHGVGVDIDRFRAIEDQEKILLRKDYGYQQDEFLMFYAAEFNENKNQRLLIEALALLKDVSPNSRLLLAGEGDLLEKCKVLASKLGVGNMVNFLGYRKDIDRLLKISDIAVASSKREGLPVNIMEAMASSLPVIALSNRGHKELVVNNQNGWIIDDENAEDIANKMKLLATDQNRRLLFGTNGRKIIQQRYSTKKVLVEMSRMYGTQMESRREGARWAIR